MDKLFRTITRLVVRVCGLVVLFVGLWVSVRAATEALALYEDPARVEWLADAIERATNIDKKIASVQPKNSGSRGRGGASAAAAPVGNAVLGIADVPGPASTTFGNAPVAPAPGGANKPSPPSPPRDGLRLSYFFAWILALLLLLLVARVGLAALKTGGELVLYEVQIKGGEEHAVPYSSVSGRH